MLSSEDTDISIIHPGSSHRYSDNIRKTYYALQGEANVSASNCSKVVSTFARELFNFDITENDLPCKSTSTTFAMEAHVIVQHQVIDEIKKSDYFMFGSDATSRQKSHHLEQHIKLSNGKNLSLGFCHIASDDSDTLLEKCIDVFNTMCSTYCNDSLEDQSFLFKDVIRKMKCLMSDRASVMKCFDAKVAKFKYDLLEGEDCSTHFLFCNAHFLLALSFSAEQAVSDIEKDLTQDGSKLGRDCLMEFKSFQSNNEGASVKSYQDGSRMFWS